MPPKNAKKEKGGKEKLPEIDKAFFELEIKDINTKLARLRTENDELKSKNEEQSQALQAVEDDRCDVIEHLNRVAEQKTAETEKIKQEYTILEKAMEAQAADYEKKLEMANYEYRMMKEQLQNEIKLLGSKLNSLEEFRILRDDLMKKYENQEENIERMEKEHARKLYEIERKMVETKNQLKKEMEAKLIQLSLDFHDAAELCIADANRRVIRENISLNNELNLMIEAQLKTQGRAQECIKRDVLLQLEAKLDKEEKSKLFSKCTTQTSLIKKLLGNTETMTQKIKKYKSEEAEAIGTRQTLTVTKRTLENTSIKAKTLEQQLHAAKCEKSELEQELLQGKADRFKLYDIIMNTTFAVKAYFKLGKGISKAELEATRQSLLQNVLKLLNRVKDEDCLRVGSLDTVRSLQAVYLQEELKVFAPSSESVVVVEQGALTEKRKPGKRSRTSVKKSVTSGSEGASDAGSSSAHDEKSKAESLHREPSWDSQDFAKSVEDVPNDYSASGESEDEEGEDGADEAPAVVAGVVDDMDGAGEGESEEEEQEEEEYDEVGDLDDEQNLEDV